MSSIPIGIVATLGPASDERKQIAALADAGVSIARLNASHGETDDRATAINHVRSVDAERDDTLAVMLDLPGPEIRTAPTDEPVHIETGTDLRLTTGDTVTATEVGVSQSLASVEPGDRILLDDGRIETTVQRVEGETVVVTVDDGGELGSRKGVNIPRVDLGLDVITERDERELDLAAEAGVDFVAASFVRDGDDVYRVVEALEARDAEIPVIAKIERADAVENLDGIVETADGVMVARGDLGVECPLETVPLIQKRIIRRCHAAGVPVITATEMLDSMVTAGRPTRAEATDVANAVLDGTDAVMLSGETAIGDHPIHVVETMDRIVRDVTDSEEYAELREQRVPDAGDSATDALARSARYLARDVRASTIVVASESGYTARKVAKYRPETPIVAVTPDDSVRRRLILNGNVTPLRVDLSGDGADAVIHDAIGAALDAGIAASGETVVALAGMMNAISDVDTTNTLKIHTATATLATGRVAVGGYDSGPVHRVTDDFDDVPDGAVAVLGVDFDSELDGEIPALAGIIDARGGLTSDTAVLARELGVPMLVETTLPADVTDGTTVTVDAHRGVVYEGRVDRGHADLPAGAGQ
ncbi:MAG: pyruvate kinase [Halobacteriales archaeon]|nr:pyruvate kinase [Halobacteriales archaeon]